MQSPAIGAPGEARPREDVLVVDDDPAVRTMLERTIVRGGHAAFSAADGAAGLVEAAKIAPAVIILDLRLPKMDGHTFLRRLGALDVDAAVIVSSADGDMDDVIEVMRHGAIDYLKKPASSGEVIAAIARAIEIHHKRKLVRAATTTVTPSAEPEVSMIGNPCSPEAPSASVPAAAPPPAAPTSGFAQIVERIQRGEILLPSIPPIIDELRALVTDGDVPIERVVKMVERDQGLVTRVLLLGRSALYVRAKQDNDLASTIGRIGFQTLHALIETVWVNGCFQSRDPRFTPYAQRLARFGVARAIAARALATPAKLVPATAYYGGLFADVGASFLLHVVVEKSAGAAPDPQAALAFVRQHHEAVGVQLLKNWGHRDEVIDRARGHHTLAITARTAAYATLGLLAAAVAAEVTGEDDLTGETPTARDAEEYARALGITVAARERCIANVTIELGAVSEVL